MQFCDLKAQYSKYQKELEESMQEVLQSGFFVGGPQIAKLEEQLSEYTQSYAVCCASGTDALQLSLMAAGIGPGDEVITTPFSFFATAEAIVLCGATPVFADIRENDFNIDPETIAPLINEKTKAILPVSLYGQPADMNAIHSIAKQHHLLVIEDAAQSFGASYQDQKSCGLSPMAATSFFPAKPLGCYGDGGAVFAKKESDRDTLLQLRNHGQNQRYKHAEIGLNSRLDTLQAAVLLIKFKHYESEIQQRQQIAENYQTLLQPLVERGFSLPTVLPGRTSVWAQYTLRAPAGERDEICRKLGEQNIPTAIHYPMPLHKQAAMQKHISIASNISCPVAETIADEVFSLPMSAFLTSEDQEKVCEALLTLNL